MTEESSGLLLNLTSVPIRKKKGKANTAVAAQPSPDVAIKIPSKPKSITTNFGKAIKVAKPKSTASIIKPSFSTPKEISVTPSGILKKDIRAPTSIWKKFKESHKKGNSNDSVQPVVGFNKFKKDKNEMANGNAVKKKVGFIEQPQSQCQDSCSPKITEENLHHKPKRTNKFSNFNVEKHETKGGSVNLESDNFDFDNFDFTQLKNETRRSNLGKLNTDKKYGIFEKKKEFTSGKITSLFYNNPEIPSIPHRAVHPVKEDVFSNVNFDELNLHPFLVKYLKESMGLTNTTTVQAKSIPILLGDKDALVRSQTGSGKTLAFALPMLHKLQEIRPKINRSDGVYALVITPTRELALQTYEVFNKLVKSYTWIVPGYLVGGEKRKSEKARLRKGITILIGTPGRLIDHVKNTKALKLDKVKYLIIDEADRMLDMGYEKDVSTLLETLNTSESGPLLKPNYIYTEDAKEEKLKNRQTVLLSATLSSKVQKLAGLSLRDPVFVDACDKNLSSSGHVPVLSCDIGAETDTMVLPKSLVQKYVVVPPKLKLVTLASFILQHSRAGQQKKVLVFVGTQDMVDYYTELLSVVFGTGDEGNQLDDEDMFHFSTSGVELFKLHGNMKQSDRTEVFKTYRKSALGVLLCTDVAARGLDLPEVDWVIQFTGPISVSDYVHRVGRTARGGQSGSSIIFLTPNEVTFIGKLENCQIRLQEEKMETCLNHLLTINPRGKSVEEEATDLQMKFEKLVQENKKMYDLACKAYSSWSRFYASYPRNMRDAFSVKTVHQGHYAKSFALRDAPSAIIKYARTKNLNEKKFPRKRPNERDESKKSGFKFVGRSRISNYSEFDSGLEPIPKKKKKC
ncbi:hypothetical protein RUM43_010588 [Polyplax serrata]|uniref:ATP-dependent RNA helicase n=1 Tax=Polyplax serrata TaxID=468196 RepID=A0AAN8S4Y4_POLSC